MATVVFMRGPNTAQLIEQAIRQGVYLPTADNVIVLRLPTNSPLNQRGDVDINDFNVTDCHYIVVCNGGVPHQLVGPISWIMAATRNIGGIQKVQTVEFLEIGPETTKIHYEMDSFKVAE